MAPTPRLLNEQQCSHCEKKSGHTLAPCTECKAVRYCSKEHQEAHWPTHESQCSLVKKARILMENERSKLRNHTGHWMTPVNPFSQPCHIWDWIEPYMRAKSGFMHVIREIRTREAIQIAHEQTLDVFRINRSDNMGMRYSAPALMIRLGKDQEAYDFIKWYATVGSDSQYDWGSIALPFLDLHNENMFEPVDVLMASKHSLQLSHTIALTLLKLRLLLDLHALKLSASAAHRLPQELLDHVRDNLVSHAVASHQDVLQEVRDGIDIFPRIRNVGSQVDTLFEIVKHANSFFWPAMAEPGAHLTARPDHRGSGSEEEMQIFLQASYHAWEETPGAIEWVKSKLARS